MKNELKGKKIILGVSAGIAAYKSVELLRLFKKMGADVFVVMSKNAVHFVTPLTFEAVSGHRVYHEMFTTGLGETMRHIDWSKDADVAVIAPATADIIAKMAAGMADDPLSTIMLAIKAPVVLCPAMNSRMYENRFVHENIDRLEAAGYKIIEPNEGDLACGEVGPGRMAEPAYIAELVEELFLPKDLLGKTVLVTAGPTREAIDPVRFISNHSSGKMGYAMARAAASRGARCILVSGPTSLADPVGVEVICVETAAQMAEAVLKLAGDADIIIKAAAVADYRPKKKASHKIKKDSGFAVIELERTIDILARLGEGKKDGQLLVGFAAETQDLEQNALSKLKKKNLDMICANLVGVPGSGFGEDTNKVKIFFADGRVVDLAPMEKKQVAHAIFDHISAMLG